MLIHEDGVLPQSKRYFFTPSTFAQRVLLYPTRAGHYFCDDRYRFSFLSDTALKASHRMNYMMFMLRYGSLELVCDGRQDVIKGRQLALFDCRQPHEYRALTERVEFLWMLFNGLQAEAMYEEIISLKKDRHVFSAADPARIHLNLTKILSWPESGERIQEQACSEMIYTILCQMLSPDSDRETDGLIRQALSYMDRNAASDLTVPSVASYVGLSCSYFTKQFRAITGYSPYEYLILTRIDLAKSLLLTSSWTVRQVAYETGYKSEENFIRSFKKTVGVSPNAFRKYPV